MFQLMAVLHIDIYRGITRVFHWGATFHTKPGPSPGSSLSLSLSRGGVTWQRASNMAVNLTDLSLPQLEGLKTQLDQVTSKTVVPFTCERVVRLGLDQDFNLDQHWAVGR